MPQVSDEEAYTIQLRIRNAYLEDEVERLHKALEEIAEEIKPLLQYNISKHYASVIEKIACKALAMEET